MQNFMKKKKKLDPFPENSVPHFWFLVVRVCLAAWWSPRLPHNGALSTQLGKYVVRYKTPILLLSKWATDVTAYHSISNISTISKGLAFWIVTQDDLLSALGL